MKYVAHEVFGVFEEYNEFEVDRRLEFMPYAQCGVRFNHGNIEFYSYTSLIAVLDTDGFLNWDYDALPNYSRSTARQFSAFCREYCPGFTYQDWKEDYLGGACGRKVL